jgi:hypothetical protein
MRRRRIDGRVVDRGRQRSEASGADRTDIDYGYVTEVWEGSGPRVGVVEVWLLQVSHFTFPLAWTDQTFSTRPS